MYSFDGVIHLMVKEYHMILELEDIPFIKDFVFEKTYIIGTNDTNNCFSIKLVFSAKCLRSCNTNALAKGLRIYVMLIADTLIFMQNISWHQYEFSMGEFLPLPLHLFLVSQTRNFPRYFQT